MCISNEQRSSAITFADAPLLSTMTGDKRPRRSSTASTDSHQKRKNRHIIVQHDYHDHATEDAPNCVPAEDLALRGSTAAPFPQKLYEMLEHVEEDGNAHIVSWQPHGRCFVVHKPDLFKQILPRYFTLSKIASFQRQLNLYGFSRLTRSLDKGGYYHEMFLRGKAFLTRKIQRVKVKGTGVRARSNPEQEPDFWCMSWVGGNNSSSQHQQDGVNQKKQTTMSRRGSDKASVVSHEDEQQHQLVAQPTYSSVPRMVETITNMEPLPFRENEENNDDVLIMTGWGQSFYLLDALPDEFSKPTVDHLIHPHPKTTNNSKMMPMPKLPAEVASSSSLATTDPMDEFIRMDLDDLVGDILGDEGGDDSLAMILQRIVE